VQRKGLEGGEEELHGEICIWKKAAEPLYGAGYY